MIVSRISSDARVHMPDEVLDALGLQPNDGIAFEIEGGRVVITRVDSKAADADQAALKSLVDEALNDPRPPIPAKDAFARVRKRLEERWAADGA